MRKLLISAALVVLGMMTCTLPDAPVIVVPTPEPVTVITATSPSEATSAPETAIPATEVPTVTATATASPEPTGTSTPDPLWLTPTPQAGGPVVEVTPLGDDYEETLTVDEMLRIRELAEQIIALTNSAPTPAPTGPELRTTANLNLRSGPGTGYTSLMIMDRGSRVIELERQPGWVRVYHVDSTRTGWASEVYLAPF